jgi:hypothetical protein
VFAGQTIYHLCIVILAILGLAGILAVTELVTIVRPAVAAEKSADLAKYCRDNYGLNAFPNIDRRDNGLMCSLRTSGGLGLLHRKIDAADVCAAQHGTRRFRPDGKGVICITGPSGGAQPARTVDLAKYCRDKYGATAIVSRRLTDNRPLCTVRTDGGLAQTHHLIDLAAVCGGAAGTMDGDTLICGGGDAPRADVPNDLTRPGPTAKPRPGELEVSGPPPPGGVIDAGGTGRLTGRGVTRAHLAGCGSWIKRRKSSEKDLSFRNPKGRGTRGWQWLGVASPCPWLKDGLVVRFQDVCKAQNKLPLVWHPVAGIPICGGNFAFDDDGLPRASTAGLLGTMPMTYLCRNAYYNEVGQDEPAIRTNTNADKIMPIVKYIPGTPSIECFFVVYAYLNLERIEYVSADLPRTVLTKLRSGLRFVVRLTFSLYPGDDSQPVTLRQLKGGASIKITAKRVGKTNVFETGVVTLTEKVTP